MRNLENKNHAGAMKKSTWPILITMIMTVMMLTLAADLLPVHAMANPFTDYDNLAAAEENAGFSLDLPLIEPEGYGNPVYRSVKGSFLEVVYTDAEGNDYRLRKGLASDGDASGDYNIYEATDVVTLAGVDFTIRRNGELVYVISASDGTYSYALTSDAGIPVSELMSMRRRLFETWLPDILTGQSKETCEEVMGTFFTKMYDTGISLMYLDDMDPDYFFYIPLDDEGNAATVAYMFNQRYELTDPVVEAY